MGSLASSGTVGLSEGDAKAGEPEACKVCR
jgi:hypothetical protein